MHVVMVAVVTVVVGVMVVVAVVLGLGDAVFVVFNLESVLGPNGILTAK